MKRVMSVAVASVVLGSAGANAHVPEAEWAAFKKDYAALVERVNALSAENEQLKTQVAAGMGAVTVEDLAATNVEIDTLKRQNTATGWAEKVKWQGDFRYRYEDIDEDNKDDRQRHRMRARAALIAKPSDTIEVGLGLASGGDDPVSTNQTLGGGGSTKDIKLDLAYARWQPGAFWLSGGKVKNPYYKPFKSALIWDDDFRPEGIFAGWEGKHFFINSSYVQIESDTRDNLDETFWGAQVGGKLGPVTLAAGYLDIPVSGLPAIYGDSFFGNSSEVVNGEEVYKYDYNLYSLAADVEFNLGSLPLGFYADFVQNDDADNLDQGYIVGAKLGSAKKQGTWQIQYQWQSLEADATFGLMTDSDFMGGGTDGEGHKIGAAYALMDKWTLGFTYFDGSRGVDLGDDNDYQRLQVDAQFKY